jgi:hypothetical protein
VEHLFDSANHFVTVARLLFDQRQQQQFQIAVTEHATATTASAALQTIPIPEPFAFMVMTMATAATMEFVSLAAVAAFVVPTHAVTVVMALHKAMEQGMPVHRYNSDISNCWTKRYIEIVSIATAIVG